MWSACSLETDKGDIYIGSTEDPRRRVQSHQRGEVQSTNGLRPVTLKSYVAVVAEDHACRLERYVKSGCGKAFAGKRLL